MTESNTPGPETSNVVVSSSEPSEANKLVAKVETKVDELWDDLQVFKNKVSDVIDDIDLQYIKNKIEAKANSIIEDVKEFTDKADDKIDEAVDDVKGWLTGNKKTVVYAIGAVIILVAIFSGVSAIFPV